DGSCDTVDGESTSADDCDDGDASINPGAAEIEDDGIDQDCDGADTITCIVDADMDGYGTDAGTTVLADDGSCDTVDGESTSADDCDDGNAAINPGVEESATAGNCTDGDDNDCDGFTDTDPECVCDDIDGDQYGDPASLACTHPELDCDDGDAAVNPGATEGPVADPTCSDLADNDCDGCFDEDDADCGGQEDDAPGGCTPGDLIDDDCDGCITEEDADCGGQEDDAPDGCTPGDLIDDDCDGCITEEDVDCGGTELVCDDGVDDDCDDFVDCDDDDCFGPPDCITETNCSDGEDNDDDTFTDCADVDCAGVPPCP
ncbi:MopE-related protein, partial [Thermodesulfobacteriota bacterium]